MTTFICAQSGLSQTKRRSIPFTGLCRMTRIHTVSAINFKSLPSFRHDLEAVTIIVGDNFTNKTAILQAVQLGLLGWLPGIPKTNQGVWSMSSGNPMAVELRLADGKKIEREFVQKGASINRTETVPPAFTV